MSPCGTLCACYIGGMQPQHGSGRFCLKEGAGAIFKAARVRLGFHRYELGHLLGFENRRSAQEFVTRLEHDELTAASTPATMGHAMNACGILLIPFDDVAKWERIA